MELPASFRNHGGDGESGAIYAGVRYERIEGYDTLQWPVHEDGTGEPILYTKGFAFPDRNARLHPLVSANPKSSRMRSSTWC